MGALDPVDEELQSLALAQHLIKVAGLAGGKLLLAAQRRVQDWGEAVNPLVRLRLAHPEEQPLHRLDGVAPETHQDEHQLARRVRQPPLAPTAAPARRPGGPRRTSKPARRPEGAA